MNIKIIFSIIACIVETVSFFPYFKNIFSKKTKPHIYSWLIWTLTQGTAATGIWYGGGGWGGLGLSLATLLVFCIFLLSFKFGTKNITKSDTIVLATAVTAIIVWWQLKNPVLAVLMVSAIDMLGYIPSFRKSYFEPWSETLTTWIGFIIADIFAIAALKNYNLLTLSYLVALLIANPILILICLVRRPVVPRSSKV